MFPEALQTWVLEALSKTLLYLPAQRYPLDTTAHPLERGDCIAPTTMLRLASDGGPHFCRRNFQSAIECVSHSNEDDSLAIGMEY